MAKLTKLKSVLKKMTPFKLRRSNSGATTNSSFSGDDNSNNYYTYYNNASAEDDNNSNNLHPVYVGKSRRRYLVGPDVVNHPLFQELVDRSSSDNSEDYSFTVGCEVVLFDHLLWMLENGDDTLDELADFYAS